MRKRGFPPVVDERTSLLVLGSLPGEASIAAGRYYAHPRNLFWRLLGDVIGHELDSLSYEARLTALQRSGVGLWDVIGEAARPGSLDSAIRDPVANDLIALVESARALKAIAFNGGKAAKAGRAILAGQAHRWALIDLPSSSPAYAAMPYAAKAQRWAALGPYLTTFEMAARP